MTCGKWFTALGLVLLMAVSASATTPLVSNGLLLYFGFDGMTAGPGGVIDGSGYGTNGTAVRGVYEELGIRGTGARFAQRVHNYAVPPEGWVRPIEIPDPYVDDFWPNDSTTPANNYDYNYIWMYPSDFDHIPTTGFSESAWVKATQKTTLPSGDQDSESTAIFNAAGYTNDDMMVGEELVVLPGDHRNWPMHLELRPDGYRTTLRGDRVNVWVEEVPGDPPTPGYWKSDMVDIVGKNDTVPNVDPKWGVWTHLVWTFDKNATITVWDQGLGDWKTVTGPQVNFYENGVLLASFDDQPVIPGIDENHGGIKNDVTMSDDWDWGARVGCNLDNSRQFVGVMDELYLFDRALSQAEVTTLYSGFTQSTAPIAGDANLDGVVNEEDASILGANWLVDWNATWLMGDFNNDQKVDDKDAAILAAHWGDTAAGSVPEPSTIALLLGALASLLVWRRRG